MGCVSSTLLNSDDDFTHIGTTSLGHHIVSLTSTTYGLLSLDPPNHHHHSSPTTPPPCLTLLSEPSPRSLRLHDSPEVINSWELMAGLDPTTSESSFRFSNPLFPPPTQKSLYASCAAKYVSDGYDKFFPTKGENRVNSLDGFGKFCPPEESENSNPNHLYASCAAKYGSYGYEKNASCVVKHALDGFEKLCPTEEGENSNPNLKARGVDFRSSVFYKPSNNAAYVGKYALDGFEKLCPPRGENRVVIYTTTLRGVRKTFEACNAVRTAMEGLGVAVCERDVSMDRGFREELRELMKGKDGGELVPPRVFVRGRYVGGAEEVMRVLEDGCLGELLKGLPKVKVGVVCEGCGGGKFLPCFSCNGSCKMVMEVKGEKNVKVGRTVVVKCPDCNENGLVLCPICR